MNPYGHIEIIHGIFPPASLAKTPVMGYTCFVKPYGQIRQIRQIGQISQISPLHKRH